MRKQDCMLNRTSVLPDWPQVGKQLRWGNMERRTELTDWRTLLFVRIHVPFGDWKAIINSTLLRFEFHPHSSFRPFWSEALLGQIIVKRGTDDLSLILCNTLEAAKWTFEEVSRERHWTVLRGLYLLLSFFFVQFIKLKEPFKTVVDDQCDRSWQFLKVLGHKFSHKSGPNICCPFEKHNVLN